MAAPFLEQLRALFTQAIPHARDLGIHATAIATEHADLSLPYRDDWLGDAERGLIHTGVVTTLVDTACGLAVLARIGAFDPIATLDLRMEYLRPSVRGHDLHCRAECHRATAQIAFVRASAWQLDRNEPVAVAQAVFMRGSQARRARGPL